MITSLIITLLLITPIPSEPTESVIFQPVDQIFNILTTAIDFNQYQNALLNGNDYTFKIK